MANQTKQPRVSISVQLLIKKWVYVITLFFDRESGVIVNTLIYRIDNNKLLFPLLIPTSCTSWRFDVIFIGSAGFLLPVHHHPLLFPELLHQAVNPEWSCCWGIQG